MKQIEYWKTGAEADIDSAEILIEKAKTLHGLFFCHLSIEKILKAHFVKSNKTFAPKTHDLIYLAEKSDIDFSGIDLNLLPVLMKYQLEGRYPDTNIKTPDKEKAKLYLLRTKELLQCLIKEL